MMNDQLLHVQNYLRTNNILICFSGKLSQELIEEYGTAVKKYLEADERPLSEVATIFSVFIEQTQNIKNYCSQLANHPSYEEVNQSCIVTIGKTESGHYISSGNMLLNEDAKHLQGWIEQLIEKDKQELKRMFKERLKQDLPAGSAGAGLGLIDIARKASRPLEYSVTPLNEIASFFTLRVCV